MNEKANIGLYKEKDSRYFSVPRNDVIDFLKTYLVAHPRRINSILDVGCGTGATARLLKTEMNIEMYVGIELVPEMALEAQKVVDRIICENIESMMMRPDFNGFDQQNFDLIMMLDVLEHLVDPWSVLCRIVKYLKEGGIVLLSIPNVSHSSFVLRVLKDRFFYDDIGILDKTHLRWFTWSSILALLRSAELNPLSVMKFEGKTSMKIRIVNAILLNRYRYLMTRQYFVIAGRTGDQHE